MNKKSDKEKYYCLSYRMAKYLSQNGHPIIRSFPSRNGAMCYEFFKTKLLQQHIEDYKDMTAWERHETKLRARESSRKREEAEKRMKKLGLKRELL